MTDGLDWQPRPYRIVGRTKETADTATLALTPIAPEPATFEAGQFNMLYAFGVGEVAISISGDPTVPSAPTLHTIRSVGAVTRALFEARPGATVGVRGPFGTGWDVTSARGGDVVFVAGGIGLAPLRPAILQVLAERDRYSHVVVLVGGRSVDDVIYRRVLGSWRSRFDVDVEVTVDYAPAGWRGHVGVVSKLVARAPFDPPRTVAFLCGPEAMMRSSAVALIERGVVPSAIRVSLERNMKCGMGVCGRCQFGPLLICRDGPVVTYDRVAGLMELSEL